jgi:uncharacterized damage-inducible protein DinB
MNASLSGAWKKLEAGRHNMLALVSHLPEEKLSWSPHSDRWSIAEILTHLITVERLSLSYMQKKIQSPDTPRNSGILEKVKLTLLIISQRLPLRYKAPAAVVKHTPKAWTATEISDNWSSVRCELRALLESLGESQLRQLIFKHPAVGRLDVRQCMVFLCEHMRHHEPQIRRLLRQMNA